MITNLKAIVAAAALIVPLSAADANTRWYDVDANTRDSFNLRLCSPVVDIEADGDDSTDLDFWLYNPSGRLIHVDTDPTDLMMKTVRRNVEGCSNYTLIVRNLGDEYNRMELTVDDRA